MKRDTFKSFSFAHCTLGLASLLMTGCSTLGVPENTATPTTTASLPVAKVEKPAALASAASPKPRQERQGDSYDARSQQELMAEYCAKRRVQYLKDKEAFKRGKLLASKQNRDAMCGRLYRDGI
ncbi:MAG: hypothetical protein CBC34_005910 [Hyphomicrobiaceae bacterium TMED74]|nr:hypothetical protein [Filomicrobium sp.]RPG43974.1 MAG: hypothetical protein CBC34_005910 [Hyphomicrobiaceae bacterium TMED74]